MGQFSWITQDTNESIRSNIAYRNKNQAYMHDNKQNVWFEKNYDGYGEFDGKDYYQLLAEMNNIEGLTGDVDKDRVLGIDLAYSDKPYISPNLTRHADWEWIETRPEDCPNQGWAEYKK